MRTRHSVGSLAAKVFLVKMLMFRKSFFQYYKNKTCKAILVTKSKVDFSFYNHLQSVKKKNRGKGHTVAIFLTLEAAGVYKTQKTC